MNQGDERRHEDDWWGELYDPERADAGPAPAADSVDDRFDSASRTLGGASAAGDRMPVAGAPWGPRAGEPDGAAPGPDAAEGGGPQGWRSPGGDNGPGAAPPARPWRVAAAGFVGAGPPTYEAEPTTLPVADPEELGELVPDTVMDGARYGTLTLRAASLRGDSARYRGDARRDALLTARFGTGDGALLLVVVASGPRAAPGGPRAAREVCEWIGTAVGRSHRRLAEDIHTADRGALKSGLHRLTARGYGRLRARAAELGVAPGEYTAAVRCLLLPAHPACRTRVFFGVGDGGLFRLREGTWQDLEPDAGEGDIASGPVPPPDTTAVSGTVGASGTATVPGDAHGPTGTVPAQGGAAGSRRPGTREPGGAPDPDERPDASGPDPDERRGASGPDPVPAAGPFRFRASVARPGDTLLLCSAGLAGPLRGEAALADHLAGRWAGKEPPGLADFLADAQVRVKGYADDRTAVAVWEA